MPFAAVMATGIASQLAGRAGVGVLTGPLLWLAVLQAVGIAVAGGPARRSFAGLGDLTVPIGLAVIATALANRGGSVAIGGATGALALSWVTLLWLVVRLAARLAGQRAHPQCPAQHVDGRWFLAPAAMLAVGGSTAAVLARMVGDRSSTLAGVVVVTLALGVAGYATVLWTAGLRLRRSGLAGISGAPWWIAGGCGGLAAAAIGRAAAVAPVAGWTGGATAPRVAVLALWGVATVVLLPVVAMSLRYLVHRHGPLGPGPWPPTFSTGVYALGTIQVATVWHLTAGGAGADALAAATMVLWAVTSMLRLRAAWARCGTVAARTGTTDPGAHDPGVTSRRRSGRPPGSGA